MSDSGEIENWMRARIPGDVFAGDAQITVDRDEILVIGGAGGPDDGEASAPVREAYVTRRREETREVRMRVAAEAEQRFGRKVSWGMTSGEETSLFTHVSVPVMTRLRMRERVLVDTLVEAGVARSRSEAVAWCVELVADHEQEWLAELSEALEAVRAARRKGPGSRRPA